MIAGTGRLRGDGVVAGARVGVVAGAVAGVEIGVEVENVLGEEFALGQRGYGVEVEVQPLGDSAVLYIGTLPMEDAGSNLVAQIIMMIILGGEMTTTVTIDERLLEGGGVVTEITIQGTEG